MSPLCAPPATFNELSSCRPLAVERPASAAALAVPIDRSAWPYYSAVCQPAVSYCMTNAMVVPTCRHWSLASKVQDAVRWPCTPRQGKACGACLPVLFQFLGSSSSPLKLCPNRRATACQGSQQSEHRQRSTSPLEQNTFMKADNAGFAVVVCLAGKGKPFPMNLRWHPSSTPCG